MTSDSDGYFGEAIAARYDDSSREMFSPEMVGPAVDVLARIAGGGRALEFGVGTGRIALPLSQRGVPVHGIDLSRAMVARLRAKEGGDAIDTTIGDFSVTVVEGSFSLVYLVFNTIMNLTTQAAQVACFRNAAAHLQPGGCFVIEVMLPRLQQLPLGERLVAYDLTGKHWGIDEYDIATQRLTSHHARIVGDQIEHTSTPFRYVWPAELDLMAQLADMELLERWGDWNGEPFTNLSRNHISVWKKTGA